MTNNLGYLGGSYPITTVTPFSYRSGATMMDIMERFKMWALDMGPEVQTIIDTALGGWKLEFEALETKVDTRFDEWQGLFDAFMADVVNQLEGLNDQSMANLIRSQLSQTRIALEELFSKQVALTPQQFGAKADGATDDSDALIAFFAALASPENAVKGFIPSGRYLHTKPLSFSNNENGYIVEGASKQLCQLLYRGNSGVGFIGINSSGIVFRNLTIDAGFTETRNVAHGVSFRNPVGVDWHDIHVQNYAGSSMLLFADDVDAGKYGDFVFSNLTCDGGGVASNGLNIVNMRNVFGDTAVSLNGGRSVASSPSYGVQLKNICENVHITNAYAEGWKGGLVMASDADIGPKNCSIRGAASDCDYTVLLGKAENNYIFAQVEKPATRAVSFGVNAMFNTVDVILKDIPSDMIPVRYGYHNNKVNVKNMVGFTGVVGEFTPSVVFNQLVVEAADYEIVNPASLAVDNSNRTNNTVLSLSQLAALNARTVDDSSIIKFNSPIAATSWIAYTHASGAFTFRANGENTYYAQRTTFNPGTDGDVSLGAPIRKWSDIYAVNGVVQTSDERSKADITTELDPEILAWSRVEYVKYRFKSAIEEKGGGARWHFGVIAQQVKSAFESVGLDPFEYGILCYDEWESMPELIDSSGSIVQVAQDAGNAYAVRYDEAANLEAALVRSKLGM